MGRESSRRWQAFRNDVQGWIILALFLAEEFDDYSLDAAGQPQWGSQAAGLLIIRSGDRALFLLRSQEVNEPGLWGIPGGRVEKGETAWEAAQEESIEELGSLPPVKKLAAHLYESGDFTYTTYVVRMTEKQAKLWKPKLDWENDDWTWALLGAPPEPLHPNVRALLDELAGG